MRPIKNLKQLLQGSGESYKEAQKDNSKKKKIRKHYLAK